MWVHYIYEYGLVKLAKILTNKRKIIITKYFKHKQVDLVLQKGV